MPLAKRDHPVVAAAGDARRSAFLLSAAHAIREGIVGVDVIHLRGGLVVPGAPRLPAVDRDDGALIAGERDDVGIGRVDPRPLIVVAAGRAAKRAPRLAAVDRLPRHRARHDHDVGIFRVHLGDRQVAAADAARRPRVGGDARPALAGVIGSIDPDAARARDRGVDAIAVARRDRDVRLHDAFGRQTVRQRLPRAAAVGRLEDAAARTRPRAVLPRALALFPQAGVNDVGVFRIEREIRSAGVLVFREHLLEGAAAVGRAIDAALRAWPVRVTEDRGEQPVGVARIDDDHRDLLPIAQAEVRPRLAGVGRFVDAVAHRQIRPRQPLAAADVDDVRVGRRDGDRANRAGRLIVEDRRPRAAEVVGLPDAAVHGGHVEDVGLARHTGDGLGAAAAERADRPPPQLGGERRDVEALRRRVHPHDEQRRERENE